MCLLLQVMALLMQQLDIPIPAYVRIDRLLLSHKALPGPAAPDSSNGSQHQQQPDAPQLEQKQEQQADSSWHFTLSIASVHGPECPLPMVASARVSFYDKAAVAARAAAQQPHSSSNPPLQQAAAAAAAAGTLESAAAAAAPAQPGPVDVQGLPEVLPPQDCSGAVPWSVRRTVPGDLPAVVVVVSLQLVAAADADKQQQQVSPRRSWAAGWSTKERDCRQRGVFAAHTPTFSDCLCVLCVCGCCRDRCITPSAGRSPPSLAVQAAEPAARAVLQPSRRMRRRSRTAVRWSAL